MFGGIFVHKMLLSLSTPRNLSVVCLQKMSYISKAGCVSSPNLSHSVFTYDRMISLRNFKDCLVAVVLQISAQRESIRKVNFREALTRLSLIYQLHWKKFIFHSDRKSSGDGSFIIYFRDWSVFCPFLFHCI